MHILRVGIGEKARKDELCILDGAVASGGGVVDVDAGVFGHEGAVVVEEDFDELEAELSVDAGGDGGGVGRVGFEGGVGYVSVGDA